MSIGIGLRKAILVCATASLSLILFGSLAHHVIAQQTAPRGAQAVGKEVSGRVVVEGGTAPRFSLPVQGAGRPSTIVSINPQSDGTFKASFPLGLSFVGAVTGSPGFSIRSIMYGSTDLSKEPLNITTADTAELLIVLNAPRLGSISGRVTGLKSTEGVRVVLRNNNTPYSSWEAPVAPDGSFVLTKVNPDNYTLRVSYAGIQTARQIVVASEDLKGVDLQVSRDRVLLGHVLVEGGGTAPEVVLAARSVAGVVSNSGPPLTQGPNLSRTFRLRLMDGEYAVSIPNVPTGFQVKSISYGTTDLFKEPLKLDGLGLWEIVVRLTPAGR